MTGWAVPTLVASTLLMLLVLLLRQPVARLFGPRAAYALWALPALRIVMPSLPGWHIIDMPIWHFRQHLQAPTLPDPFSASHALMRDAAIAAPPHPALAVAAPVHIETLHWSTLLMALWLGGALLWFGWQMLRYRRFLSVAMRSAIPLTRECGVDVLITDHVDGPVAAGIYRRRIFLPTDFLTRYGPAERRLALLHEGAHHDRRDILANLAALAVLALHWWNPLAHRAYRAFRADQELACDATVLADVGPAERHAYGSAVLKSVSARMPGVACALSHKAELKRRLRNMARPATGSLRLWFGGAVVSAAIGAGLLATASGQATPPAPAEVLSPADVAEIRADAERAREDGLRAGEAARREAAEARKEGLQAAAEARHENMEAAREAREEALRAAAEARVAAEQGRLAAEQARMRHDEARRQIVAVRQSIAAQCAAKGRPVSPDLDWPRLALCGDTPDAIAHRAVAEAHRGIARAWQQEDGTD